MPAFESDSPYRLLARSLDALPSRFPPAGDESHLRLLAKLFSPEEAALAADLSTEFETPAQIAARTAREQRSVAELCKAMAGRGLISVGKTQQGRLGFKLMPFVVGFYENQSGSMDAELAGLFEAYYRHGFGEALRIEPQLHRVVPVREAVQNTLEVQPFESASGLVERMQAWGVVDCICRHQKALIGQACPHPVDVCLVLSDQPGAFAGGGPVKDLTREEALGVLRRSAEAGLVHCVSNNQRDVWYICNCCTCACGVLRGMVDLGIAGVVARSAFINRVDEDLCIGCGECLHACQFGALSVDVTAQVSELRCAGCGVCVAACPQGALHLERRAGAALPPLSQADWEAARASAG